MNERIGVKQLDDSDVKKRTAREILEALPEWFGIVQAREEYIEKSASLLFFAAFDKENPIGFLA